MSTLAISTPDALAGTMRAAGIPRAWIAPDPGTGRPVASHRELAPLAAALEHEDSGWAGHEAVFLAIGPGTGALFGAFLHTTVRGPGQGGLRHVPYATAADFLRDGLRLSRAMARKSALAGLWWGGGKGVIARQQGDAWRDRDYRDRLYGEYGDFVSSLRGCFVVAEDAGTNVADMAAVYQHTRFATCIPPALGGSGNPSILTARGVVVAMEAALDHMALGSIAGKRIAMEGAGNVGGAMLGFLLERGAASIVATDISPDRITALTESFRGAAVELRLVEPGDHTILAEPCDILAPNGLGGVLNEETIPGISATLICGAANNQLATPEDARLLEQRGITLVPDFVANRMGIVNCANEQYGSLDHDPDIERHLGRDWENGIYQTVQRTLETAASRGITPADAATALADELAAVPHPIWPGRWQAVIASLREGDWIQAG